MKKIFLLAAALYLLIAPFTYHPDTKLVLYYPTLNGGKVWDIYSYLNANADDAPKFHYPPMHFWAVKLELPIVVAVGGKEVVNWLKIGGNVAFIDSKVFLYNLATKLPLLILLMLSGWLIAKILLKNGYKEKIAKTAMLWWFFNPITIYSVVMMGQNDMLAIFPFLVGLYFYYDLPIIAFLFFGLGGSIKSYPLIWAVILALIYPRASWWKKALFGAIAIGFYYATMLPFLGFDYFKKDVLFSGLSIRMFESAIDIGFGDKILVVPTLLVITTLLALKRDWGKSLKGLLYTLFTATFLILSFMHFHPQWFVWIMPFAAMLMGMGMEWWWMSILTPALMGIILLFDDKFLYWGLLSPINQNLINLPFVSELLKVKGIDVSLINNLCHSIVSGMGLYWLFNKPFKNEKN